MEQQGSRSSSVQSIFKIKFNLFFTCMLLWFSCFGCCGDFLVLQTGAITMMKYKRLKKRNNTKTKKKGKPTPVSPTPRNTYCCAVLVVIPWFWGWVCYGSQRPFFPWFSHDYSHCLLGSCGWSRGSQLLFVALLSGVLRLVLIALFFLGCFE